MVPPVLKFSILSFNSEFPIWIMTGDFDSNFPASQFPFSFKSWTLRSFSSKNLHPDPHHPITVFAAHNFKLLCHPLPEILSPISYTNLRFGFHSSTTTTPAFSTGLGFIRKLETKSHVSLFLRSFGQEYSQGPQNTGLPSFGIGVLLGSWDSILWTGEPSKYYAGCQRLAPGRKA